MMKVALVGCGGMATHHAKALVDIKEAEIVALADPVAERTEKFRDEYAPEAKLYDDFDALMASPPGGLDGVVLVTPHTQHYGQSKAALEAGLHVLVEKPMVTDSAHAYDLWRTVEETGKVLAIAFQSPYTPNFGWMARKRDAGELGAIRVVNAWMTQRWLYGTKGSWRQDSSLSGGGMMYDSGAHVFNAVMWLVNDPVVEVGCFYDRCGSPVDINGVAVMKFAGGTFATVAIGGSTPSFVTEIQLMTEEYLVTTDCYGGRLELLDTNRETSEPDVDAPDVPAAGTPQRNFVDAALGTDELRSTVRHGVMLSALMDAMYESADTGELVKVKPVPESLQ
jgi:predicted dehydrogenase